MLEQPNSESLQDQNIIRLCTVFFGPFWRMPMVS